MATTNSGTTGSELFGTTSPVTGTPPTTSATDGQPVLDLDAITVTVDAGSGVTLSGAGTLDCYVYDTIVGAWSRFKDGDFTVTNNTTRAQSWTVEVLAHRGRIKWVPTNVSFSSGSAGVTVYQLGFDVQLRGRYT